MAHVSKKVLYFFFWPRQKQKEISNIRLDVNCQQWVSLKMQSRGAEANFSRGHNVHPNPEKEGLRMQKIHILRFEVVFQIF